MLWMDLLGNKTYLSKKEKIEHVWHFTTNLSKQYVIGIQPTTGNCDCFSNINELFQIWLTCILKI